jgi:hypothetical protein
MTKTLVAAVAVITLAALSPAFASIGYDSEWDQGVYPSAGECRFITQTTVTPTGRRVSEQHQLCT